MYNTFECHFKPNQKSQSDMVDPVSLRKSCKYLTEIVKKAPRTAKTNNEQAHSRFY